MCYLSSIFTVGTNKERVIKNTFWMNDFRIYGKVAEVVDCGFDSAGVAYTCGECDGFAIGVIVDVHYFLLGARSGHDSGHCCKRD